MSTNRLHVLLLVFALGLLEAAAAAPEAGRFALVERQVHSLKPGAAETVPATAGAPIVLGEQETTGPGAAAKMLFGEGAVVSLGQNTTFLVSPRAVDEATGRSVSAFELAAGKARVFVSRFWSGRPDVRVKTRSAVVGIKGSEVVIEAFLDGRTTVTVLAGEAWAEAGGRRRNLRAGQRLRIAAAGVFIGDPETVSEQVIADLWNATEAMPMFARPLAGEPPVVATPNQVQWAADSQVVERARKRLAMNTSPDAQAGLLLADPTSSVLPETRAFVCTQSNQSQGNFNCVPTQFP